MSIETKYFCTGTCGAVITEEEYSIGLTECGTKTCSMHEKPFEKGLFCSSCGKRIKESERGEHNH